jgi:hypothetical protein
MRITFVTVASALPMSEERLAAVRECERRQRPFGKAERQAETASIGVDFLSTNSEPLGFKPKVVQFAGSSRTSTFDYYVRLEH